MILSNSRCWCLESRDQLEIMNSTQISRVSFYCTQTGVDHCQTHASSEQKWPIETFIPENGYELVPLSDRSKRSCQRHIAANRVRSVESGKRSGEQHLLSSKDSMPKVTHCSGCFSWPPSAQTKRSLQTDSSETIRNTSNFTNKLQVSERNKVMLMFIE